MKLSIRFAKSYSHEIKHQFYVLGPLNRLFFFYSSEVTRVLSAQYCTLRRNQTPNIRCFNQGLLLSWNNCNIRDPSRLYSQNVLFSLYCLTTSQECYQSNSLKFEMLKIILESFRCLNTWLLFCLRLNIGLKHNFKTACYLALICYLALQTVLLLWHMLCLK